MQVTASGGVLQVTDENSWTAKQTFGADVFIGNNFGAVIGHDDTVIFGGSTVPGLEVVGTSGGDTSIGVARFANNNGAPAIYALKSRGGSINTKAIVLDNDVTLQIRGFVDDGTNHATESVRIVFEVDDGSPVASSIGGAMLFFTAAGASGDDLAEKMRLSAAGNISLGITASAGAGASKSMIFGNGAAEGTQTAGSASIFAKDVGGVSTMHSQNEDETEATF
jgi:hypothetical protein